MRVRGVAIAWIALVGLCSLSRPAAGQNQPSEKLQITGRSVSTWADGITGVVQVEGPVIIELDRATLKARQAVVWLAEDPQAPDQRRAEIVLLGDAEVRQADATRTAPRLYVTATVRGPIRVTAEDRQSVDRSGSPLYHVAEDVRTQGRGPAPVPPRQPQQPAATRPVPNQPAATARPAATRPANAAPAKPAVPIDPVTFQAADIETTETTDGKVALVLSRGVTLIQHRRTEQGDELLELQAEKAVLFTPLEDVQALRNAGQMKRVQDAIVGAYLEGDVRVTYTPAGGIGEQRLNARRVYYDFLTDRAVLTNAVLHTMEPEMQVPVVVRASKIRQLSIGEYKAEDTELSISQFARPSYSIAADKIYVRTRDTGDPRFGNRITFSSDATTFRSFGVPLFWWPKIGGAITERGFPLRGLGIENSTRFGTGVRSEWGLFESLGQPPPKDLDASFMVDYFSDRGPALGLAADYSGGFITDPARERWSFDGQLEAYFVNDHGFDSFGRLPTRVDEPTELRGHALWEHQHFFPNDWQAQVRAGYVSDATFLEEWFERDFEQGPPHDLMAYLKRQQETEAFTLLVQVQPNNLVTQSNYLQEQFEVERLPEVGYHRIGDSLWDDRLTFFSDNRVGLLRFNRTGASLRDQGFEPAAGLTPGIPSLGQTGTNDDTTLRGDFRQEVNYPLNAGRFKVVPYGVGRYTGYDDSPLDGSKQRLFGGVGARVNTAFWAVDNSIESRLFDLHRMRHIVEPELNVFAAGTTVDRTEVFNYDEEVDGINDVQAVQLALRQRWQTKRGGPGKWRNVDVFSLGLEANFFANEPDDSLLTPLGFRGLYFPSLPEASVPRDSVNADAQWRISDNTALISDAQYNIEESQIATASVGLVVRRDVSLLYFLGLRYIEELDSNIATIFVSYDLSPKYSVLAVQNYDFGQNEDVSSVLEFRRRFDSFFVGVRFHHNERDNQSGFSLNIFPTGLGRGFESNQVQNAFNEE